MYRTTPVYMVCGPSICWPGEIIYAIFYSEEEANEFIKKDPNPFLYIRQQAIFTDESRDTATE